MMLQIIIRKKLIDAHYRYFTILTTLHNQWKNKNKMKYDS